MAELFEPDAAEPPPITSTRFFVRVSVRSGRSWWVCRYQSAKLQPSRRSNGVSSVDSVSKLGGWMPHTNILRM